MANDDKGLTATQPYRNRHNALKLDSEDWRAYWEEIGENFMPRKGKYLGSNQDQNKSGTKKHSKIINGTARDALRTIAAGMQGGLTSPSRPWFVLALPDEDLMEFAPVKDWLHMVRQGMLNIYARSNFYPSIHGLYKELAAFGTSAMLIEEDLTTVIRCRPFTIGEFRLALDARYRPDILDRQFSMTAEQMLEKFGEKAISEAVLESAKDSSRKDQRAEVVHFIGPMKNRDRRGMSYESIYYELKGDGEKFLRRGGYRGRPFVAPRWDITGVNTYGDCPGMDALGDQKMLQKLESDKLQALAKMVRPPMNAPLAMKGKGGTILPGGVNYVDVTTGAQGFTPTYQVKPNLQDIAFEIDRVESRIRKFFFNDLFLSVLGTDKNMTATEVVERHEEKMLMLGPVIERLQAELLDVVIERTYSIMDNLGMLPPVPPELSGQEIKIEYISLLAQAQRIVGTTAIQRTAEFVVNLSKVYPQVLDKFDPDEAVDQVSTMYGTPPKIVISDDKVREKREKDAEIAAAQASAAQMVQAVDSGKTLSDTELDKGSALDAVIEQQGGVS